jgi:hypothetical protein
MRRTAWYYLHIHSSPEAFVAVPQRSIVDFAEISSFGYAIALVLRFGVLDLSTYATSTRNSE